MRGHTKFTSCNQNGNNRSADIVQDRSMVLMLAIALIWVAVALLIVVLCQAAQRADFANQPTQRTRPTRVESKPPLAVATGKLRSRPRTAGGEHSDLAA